MIRVDQLKGVLILAVVLGHLLPGTYAESLGRWIIYSFHMPLFLAVSGFLAVPERLRTRSAGTMARRLWNRPVRSWGVAMVAYITLEVALRTLAGDSVTPRHVVSMMTHPLFHLWYVPVLVACVATAWALARRGIDTRVALVAAAAITIGWLLLARSPEGRASAGYRALGDNHLLELLVWFVLGQTLRAVPRRISWAAVAPAVALGAGVRIADFWLELPPLVIVGGEVLLNGSLIAVMLTRMAGDAWPAPRWLADAGRASLPIYLWHALPLQLVWATGYQFARPWATALVLAAFLSAIGVLAWRVRRPWRPA